MTKRLPPALRLSSVCAIFCCVSLALVGTLTAQSAKEPDAADWPQFLGPHRDGISGATVPLLEAWPVGGPTEGWRVSGGVGMSGIAISRQRLCTLVQKDGKQWLIALDPQTGKQKWQTAL